MKRLCKIFFSAFLLIIPCILWANTCQSEFESGNVLKQRPLLITGCARSGTTFVTKFFKLNGYDVNHERDGLFGVVAWTMTADSDNTPWGPGFNNYKFEHIFHQVRHPLKTIASAGNEPPVSWQYVKKFVPEIEMDDPKIVKGAKYWYYWNLLAEEKAELTYRVEDIENQVSNLSSLLEVELNPVVLKCIPTNTNTRGYQDVYTWEDLREALDEELYHNIVKMATRYGYDTNNL